MNITVANYKAGATGVSIMRGKSILQNKYHIGKDGTREQVIAKYRVWLWEQMQDPTNAVMAELRTLLQRARHEPFNPLVLVCCCNPLPCHGDIVKKAIEWLDSKVL